MRLSYAMVGIGGVALASFFYAPAGAAEAAPAANSSVNSSVSRVGVPATAEAPWFQRYTSSAGAAEGVTLAPGAGEGVNRSLTWAPSARWGVTLNMREQPAAEAAAPGSESSVQAFYHFTPRLRVGGEVSVAAPAAPGPVAAPRGAAEEASAGVKLESAFKF